VAEARTIKSLHSLLTPLFDQGAKLALAKTERKPTVRRNSLFFGKSDLRKMSPDYFSD